MILRSVFNKMRFLRQCSTFQKSLKVLLKDEDSAKILNSHKDTTVTIKGWVKTVRKMKENIFFDVSDGSTHKFIQVVIPQSEKPQNLTPGSSVIVNGFLSSTPKGQIELNAREISMCNSCSVTDGYPFIPRQIYTPEAIREHLHLRTRTNFFTSMLRVRHVATQATHEFFDSEGFTNVPTPILTSNDCEGAGEVFRVIPDNKSTLKSMRKDEKQSPDEAYFDAKAYLTVSGQLHLEAAAHGLNNVYTFGPVFRAENSKSRLHLSEFYMVEAELSFVSEIELLMSCIERLVKHVTDRVLTKCEGDLSRLRPKDNTWINKPFTVLKYDEAVKGLNQEVKKDGFTKEQELLIVKKNANVPVFVIDWPKNTKPFYMRELPDSPDYVSALDLLVPNVGELVGGGLRENNYEKLKSKLPLNSDELEWYLDLRKFGSVPTGGFGLGFERYLQLVTDAGNIKDTIPFPRWPHNCSL